MASSRIPPGSHPVHVEPHVAPTERAPVSAAPPRLPAKKPPLPRPVDSFVSFAPPGMGERMRDRALIREQLENPEVGHLTIDSPRGQEHDEGIGRVRFSKSRENTAQKTLVNLAQHLSSEPNMSAQDLRTLKQAADHVYKNRGWWSAMGDVFGKSEATLRYQEFNTQIEKAYAAKLDQANRALGEGVIMPRHYQNFLRNLISARPEAERAVNDFFKTLREVRSNKTLSEEAREKVVSESGIEFFHQVEEAAKERNLSDGDMKVFAGFLNPFMDRVGLRNHQFFTDSTRTLLVGPAEAGVGSLEGRFYGMQTDAAGLVTGANPKAKALSLEDRKYLGERMESARMVGKGQGYGDTKWLIGGGGEPRVSLLTHSGWMPESIPRAGEKALFKARRTLGLANGDRVQMGHVALDFSRLGEVSRPQSEALLDATSKIVTAQATGQTREEMVQILEGALSKDLFSDEQRSAAKEIITRFTKEEHDLATQLHADVTS